MKIQITSRTSLSNSGLHRSGGLGSPYSRWSLRNEATGAYVAIGSHRGDKTLVIEIDLEDGTYTLATGRDGDRIEQTVAVGEAAAKNQAALAELVRAMQKIVGVSRSQTDYAARVRLDWAKSAIAKGDKIEIAALKELTSARAILDHKDGYASDALAEQEGNK